MKTRAVTWTGVSTSGNVERVWREIPISVFLILAALPCSRISVEAAVSSPEAYQVEGLVKFDTLGEPASSPQAGKPALPRRWQVPFKVQIHGNRWRIDLPPCERHPDDASVYFFDGNATFALHSFPDLVEKSRRSGVKVASNVGHARIYKLPFPRDMNALEGSLVWLTYCSEHQFANATPRRFVPVFAYGAGLEVFDESTEVEPQAAYWVLSKEAPQVPASLVTILTLPRWVEERVGSGVIKGPRAPLTNVVYVVESFTNIGSCSIPLSATATLFKVDVGPATMQSRAHLVMQLSATSVSTGTSTDLTGAPSLPGPTTMVDERFAAGSVRFANQSHWITEGETTNSPQYRTLKVRALQKPQSRPVSSRCVRYCAVAFMLATTLVAVGAIIRVKITAKKGM